MHLLSSALLGLYCCGQPPCLRFPLLTYITHQNASRGVGFKPDVISPPLWSQAHLLPAHLDIRDPKPRAAANFRWHHLTRRGSPLLSDTQPTWMLGYSQARFINSSAAASCPLSSNSPFPFLPGVQQQQRPLDLATLLHLQSSLNFS